MSMSCPHCGAWTQVKETRTNKTDNVVMRRYECANLHRFKTVEGVQDELLQRKLQPGAQLPRQESARG